MKTISVNTNQLHDPQTQIAFYNATLRLQDDNHKQTADEIVWLWNSLQTELKRQGRNPMYMPNALKWLTNDAETKVKQARGGKYYSISRAVSTVNRLAQKLGMTDE